MEIKFRTETAIEITATFEGSVQEYALMWLNLTNNAREHQVVFYDIKNHYNNDVTILICADDEDEVVKYLKRIGLKILLTKEVTCVCPYVEYSYDDFDEYGYVFKRLEEY